MGLAESDRSIQIWPIYFARLPRGPRVLKFDRRLLLSFSLSTMAEASSSSLAMPKEKPVVVRVKRKANQMPLDALCEF